MNANQAFRERRLIRLKDYDYSSNGAYFVTTNAYQPGTFFGSISDGTEILNQFGKIVQDCWEDLPTHYQDLILDSFVVMPDHIHGIIFLDDSAGGSETRPYGAKNIQRRTLSEIVSSFKSYSSRRINDLRRTIGKPVWQRGYYEHVIRTESELNRIRQYVAGNPANWSSGKLDRGDEWS